jgi:hypothetical protein
MQNDAVALDRPGRDRARDRSSALACVWALRRHWRVMCRTNAAGEPPWRTKPSKNLRLLIKAAKGPACA